MKKITLTYQEIELMQFILSKVDVADWWINEPMHEKIEALQIKLTAMRAQSEYLKARGE